MCSLALRASWLTFGLNLRKFCRPLKRQGQTSLPNPSQNLFTRHRVTHHAQSTGGITSCSLSTHAHTLLPPHLHPARPQTSLAPRAALPLHKHSLIYSSYQPFLITHPISKLSNRRPQKSYIVQWTPTLETCARHGHRARLFPNDRRRS